MLSLSVLQSERLSTSYLLLIYVFFLLLDGSNGIECYKYSGYNSFENDQLFAIAEVPLTNVTCSDSNFCYFAICIPNGAKWVQGCKGDVDDTCHSTYDSINARFYSRGNSDFVQQTCEEIDCRLEFYKNFKAASPDSYNKLFSNHEAIQWPSLCNSRKVVTTRSFLDITELVNAEVNTKKLCQLSCVTAFCKTNSQLIFVEGCPNDVVDACDLKDEQIKKDMNNTFNECLTSTDDTIKAVACKDKSCPSTFLEEKCKIRKCPHQKEVLDKRYPDIREVSTEEVIFFKYCDNLCAVAMCHSNEHLFWIEGCPHDIVGNCDLNAKTIDVILNTVEDSFLWSDFDFINGYICKKPDDCRIQLLESLRNVDERDKLQNQYHKAIQYVRHPNFETSSAKDEL